MKAFDISKKILVRKRNLLVMVFFFTFAIDPTGIISSYAEIIPLERRINWSPGIQGGIPDYSIGVNVKDAPYNAVGDGVADDTAAIQGAINACPAGNAVYIPAGVYKLTSQLEVKEKSIVVRGDGLDNTILKNVATSGNGIKIYTNSNSMHTADSITSGATKDSTTITVSNPSLFSVGYYVVVYPSTRPSIESIDGDGCNSNCPWGKGMGQIVKITGISGNDLTLSRPLYYDFSSDSPKVIRFASNEKNYRSGIEDLKIQFENAGSGSRNLIYIIGGIECWLKNVQTYKTRNAHVKITNSINCEIRDSYFHHGHDYVGDWSYGVFLFNYNSDNLIENNIFHVTRHAMIFEGGGCGNVFGYNYSKDPQGRQTDDTPVDWLMSDISTHGRHPYMNLWEGNIAAHVSFDNIHGSSSHNTVFRNWIQRQSSPPDWPDGVTNGRNAIEIMANNVYQNIVGNIFCHGGCTGEYEPYPSPYDETIYTLGYMCDNAGESKGSRSTEPGDTAIIHGNYDYVNEQTIWDPTNSDRNLPDSYYLTSKPSFFGPKPWPIIGPDLPQMEGDLLPAKKRFESLTIFGVDIPAYPENLRIE